jgi:dihydrofolate reductase
VQVAGSAQLVQALHRAGLVDQWNLMVFPVILGSGKRLFPTDAADKQKLRLVETETYANGVQLQVLRPV